MKAIKILTIMFMLLIASTVYSQDRFSLEKISGGSVITNLGYNIKINEDSSLERKWFIINDDTCPIQLVNSGIKTSYSDSNYSKGYKYNSSGAFETKEDISAFEARFMLFDIWNEHMTTLSSTTIKDFPIEKYFFDSTWYAFDNDVYELYTVISFVARVRKSDGSIWSYDIDGIGEQIKSIKIKFDKEIFLPSKEKEK